MRRAERQIVDTEFMHQVLYDAEVIYVAMNDGDIPYVLPFNFVFHEGSIFIHCAKEGHKWDLLHKDGRVAFSTAIDVAVEKTTTRYRSVAGTGLVTFVDEAELKNAVLMVLAKRFKAPCKFPVSEQKFHCTGILKIDILTLYGKYSHPAEGPRPMPHYEN